MNYRKLKNKKKLFNDVLANLPIINLVYIPSHT